MKCTDREGAIALYVEDDLPARDVPAVAAHLTSCEACRVLAAALRESQVAVKELGDEAVDPAVLDAIRVCVMAEVAVSRLGAWAWLRPWAVAAACAAVIIAPLVWPVGVRELATPPRPAAAVPAAPPAPILAAVRRAPHRVRPAARAVQRHSASPSAPLLMRIVTDDPNVVIYWIVEGRKGD